MQRVAQQARQIPVRGFLRVLLTAFLAAVAGPLWAQSFDGDRLSAVLESQPEPQQTRYPWRHPYETLEFFEVTPGTVVVEAFPGDGWYSRILADYLGPEGTLVGADYAPDMFPLFGFFTAEQLEERRSWAENWVAGAADGGYGNGASLVGFALGSLPENLVGQADTVLFIRALHNLFRFENQGGFLTRALQDAWNVLKPGGVVGVVQHEARPDMPDDWAGGASGYLKRQDVIAAMQDAGFEYLGSIEINENPQDQPGTDDAVWRLPPVMNTSRDDPELKTRLMAVGESNRATLKFRKPMQETP
jgi:predicted methyltransferase